MFLPAVSHLNEWDTVRICGVCMSMYGKHCYLYDNSLWNTTPPPLTIHVAGGRSDVGGCGLKSLGTPALYCMCKAIHTHMLNSLPFCTPYNVFLFERCPLTGVHIHNFTAHLLPMSSIFSIHHMFLMCCFSFVVCNLTEWQHIQYSLYDCQNSLHSLDVYKLILTTYW